MKHIRGGTHTTLTETAVEIVRILEKIPEVTLISPGIISKDRSKSGTRIVTAVFTTAGMELLISGQGIQKVAVHCNPQHAKEIFTTLSKHKKLPHFIFKTRERKPGM